MSSEKEMYDRQYTLHEKGDKICHVSVHNLKKTRRRLSQVFRYFGIDMPHGSRVLDVGCGLGYWSEALHEHGFHVTGIDISSVSIESSRRRFTGPHFKYASYPDDIADSFDLIWAVDLPIINSHDLDIAGSFITSSLQRLNPKGVLIIGSHTDFSGETKGNWAHWDLNTQQRLRDIWDLDGPAIVEAKNSFFCIMSAHICRVIGKAAPIFFALKT